jgi:UDP-N-acetylmuramoyl-L-alanyl-D-glutamate--2,6-diaminopimelate ligase
MEAPVSAIASSQIAGALYDTVCITNSADDCAEVHGDDHNFAAHRIFRHLAPEGLAVVNADDPAAAELLRHFDGPALTVAIREPAEISAVLLEQYPSEQTFLLTAGNEAAPVRTQMIGVHHVYNCLMAAAVGLAYGIDLVTIARGLESVRQLPGRLERIECGQPFAVFVDCATSPQALRAALRTLRGVCQGRLICLLGAAGDEQRYVTPLWGAAADEFADVLIITGSSQADDAPRVDVEQILRGVRRRDRAVVIVDRRAAIHWALAQARPGDCVLLAGSRHGGYRVTSEQIAPLDDRAVARQWLYTVQPYCICNSGPWC